ncbi:MAG TPA: hypothetical protein VFR33_13270 [Candidatus Dormibacteraeota bacterium]|nr:hypothetical protein [Candidatus Dormibacteraeota bacterium]
MATALTIGATAASAVFVTSHLKNSSAPLQPTVLTATQSVQTTTEPAITSTYAS